MKVYTQFEQAATAFEQVQNRYAKYGAIDTEPRNFWYDLMEKMLDGDAPDVPTDAESWQLYSGMPGSERAAKALANAAREAIAAAQHDALGFLKWARNHGLHRNAW